MKLHAAGAQINFYDPEMLQATPLHWAANNGHVETLSKLVELGARCVRLRTIVRLFESRGSHYSRIEPKSRIPLCAHYSAIHPSFIRSACGCSCLPLSTLSIFNRTSHLQPCVRVQTGYVAA